MSQAPHFSAFADSVIERGYVTGADSFIVELGSNDGIFLRNFAAKGIPHLGGWCRTGVYGAGVIASDGG